MFETEIVEAIGKCLTNYIKEADIVWRCCVCLTVLASFGHDSCKEVANIEIHELMALNFESFESEPRVQQQILWTFNSILMYPIGRRKVHQSSTCMKLFVRLLEKRDRETENLKSLPKSVRLAYVIIYVIVCI